jgi:hypothetical protein
VVGGGLIACFWVMHELAPVGLGRSSEKDSDRRSSPKGCSRSARPPGTSQTTAGMKSEQNWRLEERVRAKEIKTKNVLIKF